MWLALKLLLVLILLIAVFLFRRHRKALKTADYYVSQGVTKLNGYDAFPLGNYALLKQKRQL